MGFLDAICTSMGYLKGNRKSALKVMIAFNAYVIKSRYGKSCFQQYVIS